MPDLYLHNTLSRQKEKFEPLDASNVRMYVCGPTVYDYVHIGNARPIVVFDTLYRLLKRLYPRVTYARNITDVDDKIMDRAKMNNEPIEKLTKRTTKAFHDDISHLNALLPDIEPRATQYIAEMIALWPNADRKRPCLCRRRTCAVSCAFDAGLWPFVSPFARRAGCWRTRGSCTI